MITKNTILSKILGTEGGEKILVKYNLPCLTCPMARFEVESLKLGQVCETYGIDFKKILEELNKDK